MFATFAMKINSGVVFYKMFKRNLRRKLLFEKTGIQKTDRNICQIWKGLLNKYLPNLKNGPTSLINLKKSLLNKYFLHENSSKSGTLSLKYVFSRHAHLVPNMLLICLQ